MVSQPPLESGPYQISMDDQDHLTDDQTTTIARLPLPQWRHHHPSVCLSPTHSVCGGATHDNMRLLPPLAPHSNGVTVSPCHISVHLPKPHHMSRGRWRDGRGSGHGGGGLRARTSTRQLKCNDMLSARTKLLRRQTNYRESSSPADRTATTTTARDYFSQRLGHPRQFIYPGHVCARSSFSPGRLLVA